MTTNDLRQIGLVEVNTDEQAIRYLNEVIEMLSYYGGQLRAEGQRDWWHMNDMLDDVIGIRDYLANRLNPQPVTHDTSKC